jgi:hypothetical protein
MPTGTPRATSSGRALPPSSDEEEELDKHTMIKDNLGDNEGKIHRKGTGFLQRRDLLSLAEEAAPDKHAMIQDINGDLEGLLERKGSGLVQLGAFPPSSDEEEAGHARHDQGQPRRL